MKLHYHPMSPACHAVLLFCAEADISYEAVMVDELRGALDVHALAPALELDGLTLADAPSILRHLAAGARSELYPLSARQSIDERMAWLQAGFYGEFATRPAASGAGATQVRGLLGRRERVVRLLTKLERTVLQAQRYLVGDTMTIADCLGAPIFALDELMDIKLDRFPNVARWITALRRRANWKKVHDPAVALAAAPGWDWRSGYGATYRRPLALLG